MCRGKVVYAQAQKGEFLEEIVQWLSVTVAVIS